MRNIVGAILAFLAVCMTSCSEGQMAITFEGFTNDTVVVFSLPIEEAATVMDDSLLRIDTLLIKDNRLLLPVENKAMSYIFTFKETADSSPSFSRRNINVTTQPGDRLSFKVWRSGEQFEYMAKGSDFVEGMADFDRFVLPVSLEIDRIDRGVAENWDILRKLYDNRRAMAAEWLKANMNTPAAVYVLAYDVSSDVLLEYYDTMLPVIEKSVWKPVVEQRKQSAQLLTMTKNAKENIRDGAEAPEFKLNDNNGTAVALSSFRGKWVVLDFWGTWCGYCLQGIPDMKSAYEKHRAKCEFISIDCNDDHDKWVAALDKYQMPWVHLYNSENSAPEENVSVRYAIEGYPTKIIITPEGVIHKIFVGESSDFYDELNRVVK